MPPSRRQATRPYRTRLTGTAQTTADGKPAMDMGKLKANKVPIIVDIATGLLFFIVAKLTDLTTAALVGAAVGIGLVIAQRFVKADLLGGLALFGIIMMLLSAGFAWWFQDDDMVKMRSTIIGIIGAVTFLGDGLLNKGRYIGAGLSRYIAYVDINAARLAIGLGLTGLMMAILNFAVARLFSTDVWLFYTTFGDIFISFAMAMYAISWARQGNPDQAASSSALRS
jgi:intracellular septation protein A